ncbi:hypothetical protein RRG08_019043 [Elysia crispata]|uniref:Uncharacterized protein n=1 Tax=Elysia crispata TaxID=231223 RepID=A0AAE1A5L7_9GAST|nr:hypothetical protein RRG08_019043 [Elysia crispata]
MTVRVLSPEQDCSKRVLTTAANGDLGHRIANTATGDLPCLMDFKPLSQRQTWQSGLAGHPHWSGGKRRRKEMRSPGAYFTRVSVLLFLSHGCVYWRNTAWAPNICSISSRNIFPACNSTNSTNNQETRRIVWGSRFAQNNICDWSAASSAKMVTWYWCVSCVKTSWFVESKGTSCERIQPRERPIIGYTRINGSLIRLDCDANCRGVPCPLKIPLSSDWIVTPTAVESPVP